MSDTQVVTKTFAAADIGSNTAHLLVAATDGSIVMRIDNCNEWIALGEVVAKTRSIPKEHVGQLINALKEFKRLSREKAASSLYVFGTEALRSAENCDQVLRKIYNETGIDVEIISPRREAEFSLAGIQLDSRNVGARLLLEVGGGSVQIGVVGEKSLTSEESLPLGTGRVIAESGITNPCPKINLQSAENYIDSVVGRSTIHGRFDVAIVSGGVARGLWRALHADGEKVIGFEEIQYMAWSAARLTLDRLMMRFSVKPRRAGTLLPGALVYRALMKNFAISELVVSEFGIREGAILAMARGEIPGASF